jgi:hypothetical protein
MYKGTVLPIIVDILHPSLLKNYEKLSVDNVNNIIENKPEFTEDTLLIYSMLNLIDVDYKNDLEFYKLMVENLKLNMENYPSIKFNDDIINFINDNPIETYNDKFIFMFLPFGHIINSINSFKARLFVIIKNKELRNDIEFFVNCIFVLNTFRRNSFKNIRAKFKDFIIEQYDINLNENKNLYKAINIFNSNYNFILMLKEIYSLDIDDIDKKYIAMFVSCFVGAIDEITSDYLMNVYYLIKYLNKEIMESFGNFHDNIHKLYNERWTRISLSDRWFLNDLYDHDFFVGIKSQNKNIDDIRDYLTQNNKIYKRFTNK